MRIAIDAGPMFRRRGGIGWYTYHLVKNLIRIDQENEYFLYTTAVGNENEDCSLVKKPNVRVIQTAKSIVGWRAWVDQVDIYHGTNYKVPSVGRYRRVVTIHDLALDLFPEFSRKIFGQRWSFYRTKQMVERADKIITVSQHSSHDIQELFGLPAEYIEVIYNGVDEAFRQINDESLFQRIKVRYRIRTDGYVFYVGGSEPRKNLLTLIRAYASLKPIQPFYSLVIAGDTEKQGHEIYSEIVKLGIQGQVVMIGYSSIEDLCILYSYAGVFVYPSLYEGFGIPPLEAMACGCPVITSNSSSLPEVVGKAAIMVEPLDIEGLASAIEKVLNDQQLRDKLRTKGFERVNLFSWEKTARETLAVYQKVLKSQQWPSLVHRM